MWKFEYRVPVYIHRLTVVEAHIILFSDLTNFLLQSFSFQRISLKFKFIYLGIVYISIQ